MRKDSKLNAIQKDADFSYDNDGHHAGCGLSAAGNMTESRWERNGSSGRSKHSYVDKANGTMYGIPHTFGAGGG